MKLDLALILEHFCIQDGVLYRKYAAGNVKQVKTVEAGRLVAMVQGRKFYGPDIAWTLHYELVPVFRIVQIDMDPFNLAKENLGAARRKRLLYRLTTSPRGYGHPLSELPFKTPEQAKEDWVMHARRYYEADLRYVLHLNRSMAPAGPTVVRELPARGTRGPEKSGPRPPEPMPVLGRKWFWYNKEWVSLPVAVHPSDDWRVRAAAVLKDPGVRFVYDAAQDKTLPVWSSFRTTAPARAS